MRRKVITPRQWVKMTKKQQEFVELLMFSKFHKLTRQVWANN